MFDRDIASGQHLRPDKGVRCSFCRCTDSHVGYSWIEKRGELARAVGLNGIGLRGSEIEGPGVKALAL